jgi:hypothetical protein
MCFWKRKTTEPRNFSHPLAIRSFSFAEISASLDSFKALPEAAMKDPFMTAALTVVALAAYRSNPETCFALLSFLKAPGTISNQEKNFIGDRMRDGKDYKPFSYFGGANPQNNYEPEKPFVLKVSEKDNSYENPGYATLYVTSGGADSPRPINLRKRSDGTWALWEEFLLADIITPKKDNPWA